MYILAGNTETNRRAECVIVADKYISHATRMLAERQHIPVITPKWIEQCLIAGRRLPFDDHPSYLLQTCIQ